MDKRLKNFKALCDETRLKILDFLGEEEKCVCEIVKAIDRAQSTISLQLSKLEHLGVLSSRREGKSVFYKVINKKVLEILKLFKE